MGELSTPDKNQRNKFETRGGAACLLIFLLTFTAVLWQGCASQKAAISPPAKRILDIVITESAGTLTLRIKANQSLEYDEALQVNPKGLLFQFPNTALDFSNGEFRPPENEIVRIIRTAEVIEGNATFSRIFIGLEKNVPYDLTADDNGLQIVFASEKAAPSKPLEPPGKPVGPISTQQPQPVSETMATATRIKTITAAASDDNLTVSVEADGAITNYKSFSIGSPPRIVFDLYKIKSPYTGEQKIGLTSKWAKQVRYFGHPDKLRLVLDTHDGFLSTYTSFPTPAGLLIQVGKISANASKAPAKVK